MKNLFPCVQSDPSLDAWWLCVLLRWPLGSHDFDSSGQYGPGHIPRNWPLDPGMTTKWSPLWTTWTNVQASSGCLVAVKNLIGLLMTLQLWTNEFLTKFKHLVLCIFSPLSFIFFVLNAYFFASLNTLVNSQQVLNIFYFPCFQFPLLCLNVYILATGIFVC